MQDSNETPLIHSIPATQHLLGDIGRTSTYELIAKGKIKKVKINKRTFITDTSIRAYVRELEKIALALILIFLLPFA